MPGTLQPSASDRTSRLDRALGATAGVPFYEREDWRLALALPAPRPEDLPRITKAELRAHSPGDFLPRRFDLTELEQSGEIEEESTSGTSGASVRVIFGRTWWAAQEARALRRHPLIAELLAANPAARRDLPPGAVGFGHRLHRAPRERVHERIDFHRRDCCRGRAERLTSL